MRWGETVFLLGVALAVTLAPLVTYWVYVERDAVKNTTARGAPLAVDVRLAPLFSLHRIQQIDPYSLPLPAPARPGAHWRSLSTLLFGVGEEQATLVDGTLDGECRTLGEPVAYSPAQMARWRTLIERGYRLDWRLGGMPVLVGGEPARFGTPLGRVDGAHTFLYTHTVFSVALDVHDRVLYVYASSGATTEFCGEASIEPTLANTTLTWSYSIVGVRDEHLQFDARWRYYAMATSTTPLWMSVMLVGISTLVTVYVVGAVCPVALALARRAAVDHTDIELEPLNADVVEVPARSPISDLKRHHRLLRSPPSGIAFLAAAIGRGVQLGAALLIALLGAALARSPWDTTWTRALVLLLPTTSWIAGLTAHALMHWFRAPGALSMLGWSALCAPFVYGVALCALLIEDAIAPSPGTIALLVLICVAALAVDAALVLFGMWISRNMPSSGARPPTGVYVPPRTTETHALSTELTRATSMHMAAALMIGGYLVYAGLHIMLNAHAQGHAFILLIAVVDWIVAAAFMAMISAVRLTVRAHARWLLGTFCSAGASTLLPFLGYVIVLFGSTLITDRDGLVFMAYLSLVAFTAVTLVIATAAVVGAWMFFCLLEARVFVHAD